LAWLAWLGKLLSIDAHDEKRNIKTRSASSEESSKKERPDSTFLERDTASTPKLQSSPHISRSNCRWYYKGSKFVCNSEGVILLFDAYLHDTMQRTGACRTTASQLSARHPDRHPSEIGIGGVGNKNVTS